MKTKIVIGIDLAGSDKNRSGFCVIKEEFGQKDIKSKTIFTDEEILQEISAIKPTLIAIDAPLTNKLRDRKCDLEMRKYGSLSLKLPGMQMLAKRGFNLASKIKEMNYPVIEVFPKATEKIMGIEKSSLSKSEDQADAILAAITGFLHLENKTKEVGDREGKIYIPRPSRKKPLHQE